MKPTTLIAIGLVVVLILVVGVMAKHQAASVAPATLVSPSPSESPSPAVTGSLSPTITPLPVSSPVVTVTLKPQPQATATPTVYFPMTRYTGRITNRDYGKYITASDKNGLPCGAAFTGYHDGDDLEVASDELTKPVPVFAIAAGTVRQASTVGGYGGLIVIEHVVNGQTVTAYYGHINLSQTLVKAGDKVKAGQQISVLGDACSSQTSGERKHLHFAIHKGGSIDVRGYAPTKAILQAWINPKDTLSGLHASEPVT